MLDLRARQGFSKDVGGHGVGRTIFKMNLALFYDPTNEVKTNIDVFCPSMEVRVLRQCYGTLVIAVKSDRRVQASQNRF